MVNQVATTVDYKRLISDNISLEFESEDCQTIENSSSA